MSASRLPRIIKLNTYEYDDQAVVDTEIIPIARETVIKRGVIQYSVPEKVKLGMLPPEALYYYQMEEERKKALEAALEEDDDIDDNDEDFDLDSHLAEAGLIYHESVEDTAEAHTFWQEAGFEQQRLQGEDYQQFLDAHSLELTGIQDQIESLLKER